MTDELFKKWKPVVAVEIEEEDEECLMYPQEYEHSFYSKDLAEVWIFTDDEYERGILNVEMSGKNGEIPYDCFLEHWEGDLTYDLFGEQDDLVDWLEDNNLSPYQSFKIKICAEYNESFGYWGTEYDAWLEWDLLDVEVISEEQKEANWKRFNLESETFEAYERGDISFGRMAEILELSLLYARRIYGAPLGLGVED